MKGLPFISPTTRSEEKRGNGADESIPQINYSLRAYSAKGWLTIYGTRPESRTASQAESCLQNSRSREFNLESNLFESEKRSISFFRPEFQLKNTFDPALRGVAERFSLDDLSGDETVSPTTNLCSLSRSIIGKATT
ncbi:hypothetical protein AVEN_182285-1 [Araneus ventricosus]|uniref:Uncharacterized protein n=1 Tax=Araneus ventricosus TaxID=182803 RepID=A0A4Y2P0D6_ARAVE|nr:hypothetical protein AVEN_182285-1 [Araneus ventricosus]